MVGLSSYCIIFILDNEDLVRPLTQMTCKTVPFIQMEQSLQVAKEALMKCLILVYPDPK